MQRTDKFKQMQYTDKLEQCNQYIDKLKQCDIKNLT